MLNFNFDAAIKKASTQTLAIKPARIDSYKPAQQSMPREKVYQPGHDWAIEMGDWCNDVHDLSGDNWRLLNDA